MNNEKNNEIKTIPCFKICLKIQNKINIKFKNEKNYFYSLLKVL